ncbi:porphobilinogen synthase [Parvularcula oceani]|uniref:porphobilinogen synthase n=1 Tax=Parvularcula oceani TaxID=1247963 RepID=UPI0004E118C3|nr:porphobilinogen synthase [Parvularcula oceani]
MIRSSFPGRHPATRPRRLRSAGWIRAITAESRLIPADLIQAMILREDDAEAGPVPAMPGIRRHSVDEAVEAARRARDLGLPALALFPHTSQEQRDAGASAAFDPDNLMARAARAIKAAVPGIGLIGDVALDPYTDHGHDGVLAGGEILNDETVPLLCRQALVLAEAGFDVLAPSDMMDGRVGAIRGALDAEGFTDRMILSYAVKYASRFYGPYRDAIGSRGVLQGDKRTYQMDPANAEEGLREVALDLAEGADMVMVKPGLPYLDMVTRVKQAFGVPTVAFQVSGEYAMLAQAAEAGAFDFQAAGLEALACFRRAGADAVISYYADRAAQWLAEERR